MNRDAQHDCRNQHAECGKNGRRLGDKLQIVPRSSKTAVKQNENQQDVRNPLGGLGVAEFDEA